MSRRRSELRDGYALILSILLVMGVAMLSAGMLALAGHEARLAATALAATQARTVAESAVRSTLAGWSTRRDAALAIGEAAERRLDNGATVTIERLDSTLLVVTASARSHPDAGPARSSAGVLVRVLDPDRLVRSSVPAAVAAVARAEAQDGLISGLDACVPGAAPLPGLIAPVIAASGASLHGAPPAEQAGPPVAPLLALPLREIADVRAAGGVGTPAPTVREGECVRDPWSWGTARADHPCGGSPQLIHVGGDLTVRGGEGAGILVVDGDLHASGGFTFHGLVLVRGRAVLEGVAINGALRAEHLELRTGSLRYDSCALDAAFRAPALDRPFRPATRWWIPTF